MFTFSDKMVRPVIKVNNRSTEMEIKTLKLSSEMKSNLRAPTIWEKPPNSMYDYHYEISGLYYQVFIWMLNIKTKFRNFTAND